MPQPTPLVAPNWQTIWNDVIDPSLASSKKLRMFLNDKWDCVYGKQNRILYLDTLLPVDERENNSNSCAGSCESAVDKKKSKSKAVTEKENQTISQNKLQTSMHTTNNSDKKKQNRKVEFRVERPDKSFYTETIERHAAKLVEYKEKIKESHTQSNTNSKQTDCTTILNMSHAEKTKNEELETNDNEEEEELYDDEDDDDDLEDENYPVLIAHASTLALTSLRCPQYRDVHGHVHDA